MGLMSRKHASFAGSRGGCRWKNSDRCVKEAQDAVYRPYLAQTLYMVNRPGFSGGLAT
jgi:hypothetical protein